MSSPVFRRRRRPWPAYVLLLAVSACIFRGVAVRDVGRPAADAPVVLRSPVKVHLLDGATIVFRHGATVRADSVIGHGERWSVAAATPGQPAATPAPVLGVTMDSVAAMEAFDTKVDATSSTVGSTLAVVVGGAAGIVILKAIFGSCPTIYTDSAGTPMLEAEAFSYSIAPLYERRDVDALRARPAADGALTLEVRNEALETHYINHLELVAVEHRPDEMVLPGREDRPVAVGALLAPARAVDRAGRDVRDRLLTDDSRAFATDSLRLARATTADLLDHVELEFEIPDTPDGDREAGSPDSAAVVLTLRNSLLNTVLLYDVMLAAAGSRAVDWLGRDLASIDNAVALGRWYGDRMGMRVEQWRGGRWTRIASLGDAGPIAWRRVAVPIARVAGERRVRIRLSFVADQWRIDRAALATTVRTPATRRVPVSRVTDATGAADAEALERLRAPDTRYLSTTPGTRFFARFDVGSPRGGTVVTALLAAQGYYTEWIRGDWIREAREPRPFVPGDSAIVVAMRRWQAKRVSFERQFESTRIPVR